MQSSYTFRKNIRDSFVRAQEEQTILFFKLSDWVYALFIPANYHYSEQETAQIAREIQQNILPNRNPHEKFKIVSWQEVVDANQYWHDPYAAWLSTRLTQVVFFIKQDAGEAALLGIWQGKELRYVEKPKQNLGATPIPTLISMRSLDYLKAWPLALAENHRGYLWVAEEAKNGSYRPVEERGSFDDYKRRARTQTYLRSFSAQVYVHEDPDMFGACFVGELISSAAGFPDLISGALKLINPHATRIRASSYSEDVLILSDPSAPSELLSELCQKSEVLLRDLMPDGFDRLEYNDVIDLPNFPCGSFNLKDIPAPYFDLVLASEDAKTALPPGRAEYLRGLSYELIQSWSKAVESFRIAFRYNFSDGDINHALGRSLIELGNFQEASLFLSRAQKLNPQDPDIANAFGLACLELGRQEEASALFERAVYLSPDDAQFLANLGRCYFSMKRFGEAESSLKRAIEYAPNSSEAHATLAQVKWRQGDLPAARKHARKAFAANPGSQYMQDLLWALTVDDR